MSTPTEADVQPVFDWTASTVYHCLYFVIFMVISHGTVQLFVGVSIDPLALVMNWKHQS
jgi:hypothetical protein